MKTIKRFLAGLLALSMLASLGGCKDSGEAAKNTSDKAGGYAEETIELSENMGRLSEMISCTGQISCVDLLEGKVYLMDKAEKQFTEDDSAMAAKLGGLGFLSDATCGPNGDCFAAYTKSDDPDELYSYIDRDGSELPVKLSSPEDAILSAEFSEDGRLFIRTFDRVYELNTASGALKEIMSAGFFPAAFDIVGDRIIAVDDNDVLIYNYKTEAAEQAPDVLVDFFRSRIDKGNSHRSQFDMCSGEDGSMYILCREGIFRYGNNANQVEQIVDGVITSIGEPSYYPNGIVLDGEGGMLVGFEEGAVRRYYYDPELEVKTDLSLKIYSLEENDTMTQAVSAFSAEYKNIKLDYQVGMKEGITYGDAMRDLTTQILSGNAPDVIMLDGLDIDSLIEKNMLMDISEQEKGWGKNDQLLDNIVRWNSDGDRLYSVACKFRIPAIAADEDVLKDIHSYSDIADYVERTRESDKMGEYSIIYMPNPIWTIKNALIYTAQDVITDSGLDRDELIEMYEDCSKVYQNDDPPIEEFFSPYIGSIGDFDFDREPYELAPRFTNVMYKPKAIAVGCFNRFDSDYNLATSLDENDHETNVDVRFGLNEDSRVFIPTCNLAVTEASEQKEAALKFLAFALDEQQQKKPENKDGFSVNKAALKHFYSQYTDPDTYVGIGSSDDNGKQLYNISVYWVDAEESKEFDDYINALDTPLVISSEITDIIVSAGERYLDGVITAEQAADEAIAKIDLKMKE